MIFQNGFYSYLKGTKAISFFINGIKVYIKKRTKDLDKKPEKFLIFEKPLFQNSSPYISSLFPTEDQDIYRLEYNKINYELEFLTDSTLEIRSV